LEVNKNMTKQNLIYAVVVVLVVVAGYFGWTKYQANQNSPEAQVAQAQEQKNTLIAKVKALTVLPEEEPILFTVNDANLLRSQQAFFKDAQNGDVLMVFQKDSKALIYRESENKIVNAGPISFQQPAQGKAPTPTPTKK
jgi:Flp pilus assembly protein CpaB